jgi:hypothetical protein
MTTLDFFVPGWIAPRLSNLPVNDVDQPVDQSRDWSLAASQEQADERYESYCDQKYEADGSADSR